MESTYRTWIHTKKDASSTWDAREHCRDLRTTLDTTKWQLEEFARAVQSSYKKGLVVDGRDRLQEFIIAIEDQILKIEKSLEGSAHSEGKVSLAWMRLDEGECCELALILSGPSASKYKALVKVNGRNMESSQAMNSDSAPDSSKDSNQSVECSLEAREEKSHAHPRTASAGADIGAWKIAINDDNYLQNYSNGQPPLPQRKIPGVSGFLDSMESPAELKFSNGIRKWKVLGLVPSYVGINACYVKSKSCLDSCDDCCDKQLYGWYRAIQRQLQRSQYLMQYSWSAQVTFWIIILLCVIALIALYAV